MDPLNPENVTYLYLARVGLTPRGTGRMGPVSGGPPGTGSLASGNGGRSRVLSDSPSCENEKGREKICN